MPILTRRQQLGWLILLIALAAWVFYRFGGGR
jgi:flagellar biogenesis protein FliO